jgi:hypothetical protein
LNYFNYFTEIEDAFVRRRAKHLLLSPMDWALIESWKEMEVPLHIVLRGIEKAFDSWESKPRARTIKSLLYCQEEVEAQFAEWRDARVGASAEVENGASEGLPFSRTAILQHLERGRSSLLQTAASRAAADDLTETLERAATLVADLERDFTESAAPNAQRLEQSLSGVERMISDSVRAVVDSSQLETIQSEVKEQLKPYRKQMDATVYAQTMDNLILKRLRDQFGIPRLSLFYL